MRQYVEEFCNYQIKKKYKDKETETEKWKLYCGANLVNNKYLECPYTSLKDKEHKRYQCQDYEEVERRFTNVF